jgi:hypothetical protein
MYEVLSQLYFLKPMLKFSVQINSSLAFSLQQASHTKRPKVKASSQHSKAKSQKPKAKQKVQKPQVKPQKAKAPLPPSGVFYSSKQGGAMGRGVIL